LASLKAGSERLSTDAVTFTHQNFAGYKPEDEEEDFNIAAGLIADILEGSSNLP
jgi:hypothetical protein